MIFSRDRDFEEALADPDALDNRLEQLRKERKLAHRMSVVSMSVFFLSVFAELFGYYKTKQIGTSAVLGPMMLFLSLQQLNAATSSQSDIRTLIAVRLLKKGEDSGKREEPHNSDQPGSQI